MTKLTITKIYGATCKLDGAIHAIFNNADPVVVTLLVSAAMAVAKNLASAACFEAFANHAAPDSPYYERTVVARADPDTAGFIFANK